PAEPVEVAVDSGAARGTEPGGAESGGAEPGGAETGCAGPARATSGGTLGVLSRREPLSPQRLREWYSRVAAGAAGAGATGATLGSAPLPCTSSPPSLPSPPPPLVTWLACPPLTASVAKRAAASFHGSTELP
ncbi:unnamed protein product, partial [Closterium sp. NIES-53]